MSGASGKDGLDDDTRAFIVSMHSAARKALRKYNKRKEAEEAREQHSRVQAGRGKRVDGAAKSGIAAGSRSIPRSPLRERGSGTMDPGASLGATGDPRATLAPGLGDTERKSDGEGTKGRGAVGGGAVAPSTPLDLAQTSEGGVGVGFGETMGSLQSLSSTSGSVQIVPTPGADGGARFSTGTERFRGSRPSKKGSSGGGSGGVGGGDSQRRGKGGSKRGSKRMSVRGGGAPKTFQKILESPLLEVHSRKGLAAGGSAAVRDALVQQKAREAKLAEKRRMEEEEREREREREVAGRRAREMEGSVIRLEGTQDPGGGMTELDRGVGSLAATMGEGVGGKGGGRAGGKGRGGEEMVDLTATAPWRRADHEMVGRMDAKTWADPDAVTGLDRGVSAAALELSRAAEAQGPADWTWHALRDRFRDEDNRRRAWEAGLQAVEEAAALEEEEGLVVPVVEVPPHPLQSAVHETLARENMTLRRAARERAARRVFSLDVRANWLSGDLPAEAPMPWREGGLRRRPVEEAVARRALAGRRDVRAMQAGHHQIQSVSLTRAMADAVVTPVEEEWAVEAKRDAALSRRPPPLVRPDVAVAVQLTWTDLEAILDHKPRASKPQHTAQLQQQHQSGPERGMGEGGGAESEMGEGGLEGDGAGSGSGSEGHGLEEEQEGKEELDDGRRAKTSGTALEKELSEALASSLAEQVPTRPDMESRPLRRPAFVRLLQEVRVTQMEVSPDEDEGAGEGEEEEGVRFVDEGEEKVVKVGGEGEGDGGGGGEEEVKVANGWGAVEFIVIEVELNGVPRRIRCPIPRDAFFEILEAEAVALVESRTRASHHAESYLEQIQRRIHEERAAREDDRRIEEERERHRAQAVPQGSRPGYTPGMRVSVDLPSTLPSASDGGGDETEGTVVSWDTSGRPSAVVDVEDRDEGDGGGAGDHVGDGGGEHMEPPSLPDEEQLEDRDLEMEEAAASATTQARIAANALRDAEEALEWIRNAAEASIHPQSVVFPLDPVRRALEVDAAEAQAREALARATKAATTPSTDPSVAYESSIKRAAGGGASTGAHDPRVLAGDVSSGAASSIPWMSVAVRGAAPTPPPPPPNDTALTLILGLTQLVVVHEPGGLPPRGSSLRTLDGLAATDAEGVRLPALRGVVGERQPGAFDDDGRFVGQPAESLAFAGRLWSRADADAARVLAGNSVNAPPGEAFERAEELRGRTQLWRQVAQHGVLPLTEAGEIVDPRVDLHALAQSSRPTFVNHSDFPPLPPPTFLPPHLRDPEWTNATSTILEMAGWVKERSSVPGSTLVGRLQRVALHTWVSTNAAGRRVLSAVVAAALDAVAIRRVGPAEEWQDATDKDRRSHGLAARRGLVPRVVAPPLPKQEAIEYAALGATVPSWQPAVDAASDWMLPGPIVARSCIAETEVDAPADVAGHRALLPEHSPLGAEPWERSYPLGPDGVETRPLSRLEDKARTAHLRLSGPSVTSLPSVSSGPGASSSSSSSASSTWDSKFLPEEQQVPPLGFRVWERVSSAAPTPVRPAEVFGMTRGAATLPSLSTWPRRFTWHSGHVETSRPKNSAKTLFYILQNRELTAGPNDPALFTMRLDFERVSRVDSSTLSVWRAEEQRREELRQLVRQREQERQAAREAEAERARRAEERAKLAAQWREKHIRAAARLRGSAVTLGLDEAEWAALRAHPNSRVTARNLGWERWVQVKGMEGMDERDGGGVLRSDSALVSVDMDAVARRTLAVDQALDDVRKYKVVWFYHPESGESSWDPPAGWPEVDAAAAGGARLEDALRDAESAGFAATILALDEVPASRGKLQSRGPTSGTRRGGGDGEESGVLAVTEEEWQASSNALSTLSTNAALAGWRRSPALAKALMDAGGSSDGSVPILSIGSVEDSLSATAAALAAAQQSSTGVVASAVLSDELVDARVEDADDVDFDDEVGGSNGGAISALASVAMEESVVRALEIALRQWMAEAAARGAVDPGAPGAAPVEGATDPATLARDAALRRSLPAALTGAGDEHASETAAAAARSLRTARVIAAAGLRRLDVRRRLQLAADEGLVDDETERAMGLHFEDGDIESIGCGLDPGTGGTTPDGSPWNPSERDTFDLGAVFRFLDRDGDGVVSLRDFALITGGADQVPAMLRRSVDAPPVSPADERDSTLLLAALWPRFVLALGRILPPPLRAFLFQACPDLAHPRWGPTGTGRDEGGGLDDEVRVEDGPMDREDDTIHNPMAGVEVAARLRALLTPSVRMRVFRDLKRVEAFPESEDRKPQHLQFGELVSWLVGASDGASWFGIDTMFGMHAPVKSFAHAENLRRIAVAAGEWVPGIDPASGDVYYASSLTGASVWDKGVPQLAAEAAARAVVIEKLDDDMKAEERLFRSRLRQARAIERRLHARIGARGNGGDKRTRGGGDRGESAGEEVAIVPREEGKMLRLESPEDIVDAVQQDPRLLARLAQSLGLPIPPHVQDALVAMDDEDAAYDEEEDEGGMMRWSGDGGGEGEGGKDDLGLVRVGDVMALVDRRREHELAQRAAPPPLAPGIDWRSLRPPRNPETLRARAKEPRVLEGIRSAGLNEPNHATVVGIVIPRDVTKLDSESEAMKLVPKPQAVLISDVEAEASGMRVVVDPKTGERKVEAAGAGGGGPADEASEKAEAVARAFTVTRAGRIEELRDLLISGLIDINGDRDTSGNTLFIVAAQNGNKRIMKELLRKGADPNLANERGNTALHFLIAYNHRELADYLIEKGAIDTVTNEEGLTPWEGLSKEDVDRI